jgi:hypothetical protein
VTKSVKNVSWEINELELEPVDPEIALLRAELTDETLLMNASFLK